MVGVRVFSDIGATVSTLNIVGFVVINVPKDVDDAVGRRVN
jgi:hypothetical protein